MAKAMSKPSVGQPGGAQPGRQMSETLLLGVILSLSGGCMDAYSYLCRGHVFANAQTGNILLFSVNVVQRSWAEAAHYLFPVLAFALGVALAVMIRSRFRHRVFHWRQTSLLLELVLLTLAAFVPQDLNSLANGMISFACGVQVESFRNICGCTAATTMCIGNLRSAVDATVELLSFRNKSRKKSALLYWAMILSFAVGAILGNAAVALTGEFAILFSSALLAVCFVLMFSGTGRRSRGNKYDMP